VNGSGGITHGRSGYIRRKCRCGICVAAQNEYQKRYHRMRTAEALAGGRPFGEQAPRRAEPVVIYIAPGDWVEDAACAGLTVCDVPAAYRSKHHRWPGLRAARALCDTCPVAEQCRLWVLAHERDPCPEHVVAGMTTKERNQHRRNNGIRLPGTPGKEGNAA